jgi:hypothetical protein
VVILQVGLLVGEVCIKPPSHASDSAIEPCLCCRCRIMLATVQSSHADDGATEATWPQHDVGAESCW